MKLQKSDVEITKEDQQQINQFSKLNQVYHERVKVMQFKKDYQSALDDALTELELLDEDEAVRLRQGDCFFYVKTDQAKAHIEKHVQNVKADIDSINEDIAESDKKMKRLKAVLYSKFGNSINLEDD